MRLRLNGLSLLNTTVEPRDLLPGNAYYATYFLFCVLRERGVEAMFEQQAAR